MDPEGRSRDGEPAGREPGAQRHRVVYCLIPDELAPKLHELLREHFSDRPGVEVVVERRGRDRRRILDRRATEEPSRAAERRRVNSAAGRRIAERRFSVKPAEPLVLPRRARRYADQLMFVERLEPSQRQLEDADSSRLVVRIQAGDSDAAGILYERYFERIYSYMRTCLRDPVEAEDLTQDVFAKALETLPSYELRPGRPFLAWLFRVSRNTAIDALRRAQSVEPVDPSELDRAREATQDIERDETVEQAELALGWLSDRDLAFLVERLPEAQRQVLTMKFLLDLPTEDIAAFLRRTPKAVRQLQSRALRHLEERLTGLGRRDDLRVKRVPTLTRLKPMPVAVHRRFALGKGLPRAGR